MAPVTRSSSKRALAPPPTTTAPKQTKKASSRPADDPVKSMTSSWLLDPPARKAPPRQGPFVSFESSLHTFRLDEAQDAAFPPPPTSIQHQLPPAPPLPPQLPQITSSVAQQPTIRQNAEREPTPPSPETPTVMIPSGREFRDIPAQESRAYGVLAREGTKRKRDESPGDPSDVPGPSPPKRIYRMTTPLPVDPEEAAQREKIRNAKKWEATGFERMHNNSESSAQGAAWEEMAHQSRQIHLGAEEPDQVTTGIRQQRPGEIKSRQSSLRRFVTASGRQAEKFIARGKAAPEVKTTQKKTSRATKTKAGPSQQQQNPPPQASTGENVRRSTRARKAPDRLDPGLEETQPPKKPAKKPQTKPPTKAQAKPPAKKKQQGGTTSKPKRRRAN